MDPPSRPNQPESLAYKDLANVDYRVFNDLSNISPSRKSSLLPDPTPCALEWWSSLDTQVGMPDRRMKYWNPEFDSGIFGDLPIFKKQAIDLIINGISSAHVTVVLAPTGVGKTLMGPMLHAEMLKRFGPYRERLRREEKEKEYVSWRGLSICPSNEQAQNMSKMCEKMFMDSRESFCDVFNYFNPFERVECSLDKKSVERISRDVPSPPQFAITSSRGGSMALENDEFFLKMVIIDEAHSTKPDILSLLALARRQLLNKQLEKLVLTSATLDSEEIEDLRRYFGEKGLTLAVVNLIDHMGTVKKLHMSCARLCEGGATGEFAPSPFSTKLTSDFDTANVRWPMFPHKLRYVEDKKIIVQWYLREKPVLFGYEEDHTDPEMNNLMPFVMHELHRAMEEATEMLERRVLGDTMPSILVILPGKEHVDRMRSSVQHVIEPTPNGHFFEIYSGLFKSVLYKETGKPAFILERLKPTAGKALAAKDKKETIQARKRREEKESKQKLEMIGPWKGKKGKIILATPHAAEGVTLEDIVFIIDAGVIRIPSAYSPSGLRSMILQWIDKRLLYQRAGRGGRTIDTEYFLSVTGEKVANILTDNLKPKLLLRYFDEMAWYRSIRLKVSKDLIWTPPDHLTEAFRKSFMIRGLWRSNKFTDEVDLLYDYFPFLAPEKARMVVMGVRLGLAAHVISYVAESNVTHKLCGRPTKIAENYEAIGDHDVYGTFVNVSAHLTWKGEQIRPYDMGDSVSKADVLTTWVRNTFPSYSLEVEPDFDKYENYDDKKWEEMEKRAAGMADGIFWSGRWCMGNDAKEGGPSKDECIGMKKLQNVLIREDGREALCVSIHQITRACQRLGIIYPEDRANLDEGRGNFLSPRFNRYVRGEDNYNLNEDGRALFRAILTMNSDKLARACGRTVEGNNGNKYVSWDRFEIYTEYTGSNVPDAYIFPERKDWKERENKGTSKFVRFWEGFKATHSETFDGCLDPLTTSQAAFFLNVYGSNKDEDTGIFIYLNAAPAGYKDGLSIQMDHDVADRVWKVRESLQTMTEKLLREEDSDCMESLCFAQAIIDLWKGLDDGVEKHIKIMHKWEQKVKLLDLIHGRVASNMQYNEGLNFHRN